MYLCEPSQMRFLNRKFLYKGALSLLLCLSYTQAQSAAKVSKVSKTTLSNQQSKQQHSVDEADPRILQERHKLLSELMTPSPDWKNLSKADFEIELKEASERGKRSPAAANVSDMSKEISNDADYSEFLKKFKAIKNTNDVEALLDWLDDKLVTSKPGNNQFKIETTSSLPLKFIGSQLLPLRAYKGFIYRMVPVLANVRPRAVHSFILSSVIQVDSLIQGFVPRARWKAIFDYLAEPPIVSALEGKSEGRFKTLADISDKRFTNEFQVQAFLVNEVLPSLILARERLESIGAEMKQGSTVVWDNSIYHDDSNMRMDSQDLFRRLTMPDFYAANASLEANMGAIYYLSAYNLDGYFNLLGELGKQYGIDGFPDLKEDLTLDNLTSFIAAAHQGKEEMSLIMKAGTIAGGPAKARRNVFKKFRVTHPKILSAADGSEFNKRMKGAYDRFYASYQFTALAWSEIKNRRGNNDEVSILVDGVNPGSRTTAIGIQNMANMFTGAAPIQSSLTQEQASVNLERFFVSDPIKDLFQLLPTQFDEGKSKGKILEKIVDGKNKKIYRNYDVGRSTGWNKDAYAKLFPNLTDGSDDIRNHVRVLSQAWGGWMANLPLTFVMF